MQKRRMILTPGDSYLPLTLIVNRFYMIPKTLNPIAKHSTVNREEIRLLERVYSTIEIYP